MYQKLTFIGNLGNDPVATAFTNGVSVSHFVVASTLIVDGKEITTWFKVTVTGRQAELCNQYLRKRAKVFVEGVLRPDAKGNPAIYQKADGTWVSSYEVTAQRVIFLDRSGKVFDDDGYTLLTAREGEGER